MYFTTNVWSIMLAKHPFGKLSVGAKFINTTYKQSLQMEPLSIYIILSIIVCTLTLIISLIN